MIIYKITNIKNNKCYIGQTINSLKERWQGHIKESKRDKANNKFMNAIKKYGVNSFYIEKLETCISISELNEKETYYIKKFNSVKYGYNTRLGGCNSPLSNETKDKLRALNLGKKASNETKLKMSASQLGKKRNMSKSGRKKLQNNIIKNNPAIKKRIICTDKNIIFDSITSAAKWCNGDNSQLGKKIKADGLYKGYKWEIINE